MNPLRKTALHTAADLLETDAAECALAHTRGGVWLFLDEADRVAYQDTQLRRNVALTLRHIADTE